MDLKFVQAQSGDLVNLALIETIRVRRQAWQREGEATVWEVIAEAPSYCCSPESGEMCACAYVLGSYATQEEANRERDLLALCFRAKTMPGAPFKPARAEAGMR